jgi:hypothetical protein
MPPLEINLQPPPGARQQKVFEAILAAATASSAPQAKIYCNCLFEAKS